MMKIIMMVVMIILCIYIYMSKKIWFLKKNWREGGKVILELVLIDFYFICFIKNMYII